MMIVMIKLHLPTYLPIYLTTYLQLLLVCRCKQTLDHTSDSSSALTHARVDYCVPVLSSIATKCGIVASIEGIQFNRLLRACSSVIVLD
jgi:hypothetical protein